MNDSNRNPTARRGDHGGVVGIRGLVDLQTQELETLTNATANGWRIFTNPSRKHQRIEATEHRHERADPTLRLVAEQRNGLSGSRVVHFGREQAAYVGAHIGNPKQPRLVVNEVIELLRVHLFATIEIVCEPRVEITRTGTHHQTSG